MRNLVEEARQQTDSLVSAAIISAIAKGRLPADVRIRYSTEAAKKPGFGDLACSFYLSAADSTIITPQEIARAICGELVLKGSFFQSAETAYKAYINFKLSDKWYSAVLEDIEAESNKNGHITADKNGSILFTVIYSEADSIKLNQIRPCVLSGVLAAIYKRSGFYVCNEFIYKFIYKGSRALNEYFTVLENCYINFDKQIDISDEAEYLRHALTKRGFDRAVVFIEADRSGCFLSVKESLSSFGIAKDRLEAVYTAPVSVLRNNRPVDIDESTGSLSGLLETIPPYALRYFMCSKPESSILFDTDLAQRIDGGNPSYYITYARKRLCSHISSLKAAGYTIPAACETDITLLNLNAERELIRLLAAFPEEIRLAAQSLNPSRISRYLTELSALYYKVSGSGKIKAGDKSLLEARLLLAESVRHILENGLSLLGIT